MDSLARAEPKEKYVSANRSARLAARIEPFDSYWQAPEDVDAGYTKFKAYYRSNYVRHLPQDKGLSILVISCGPGYLLEALKEAGYTNVIGIDSDPDKVKHGRARGLNCVTARAFEYLTDSSTIYDVIIPEQELNHLTLDETIEFLKVCHSRLRPGGRLIVYGLNGANPFVGSENLSHNIDHFYTFTDYSLKQILKLGGFPEARVMDLELYVFWKNPLNYVGLAVTKSLELVSRVIFMLYGKNVKVLSKKIMAVCDRPN
jgi:2-polyprenyl-3-methyl-5-hydroxy-6-metoxy-1,4-benzoquinol methylase